jgi:hypothetical protein
MSSIKLTSDPIPSDILAGAVRDFQSVHTVYKAHFIYYLMQRINTAFWDKAEGQADDLGYNWKPLAPKTVSTKASAASSTEFIAHRVNKQRYVGLLSPAQRRVWEDSYKRNRRNNSDRVAKDKAWDSVDRAKNAGKVAQDHPANLINIRTGALVRSTAPGRISGNRYYASPNQHVEYLSLGSLDIRLEIPYASEVDQERPIIPEDIREWVIYSHEQALNAAIKEYTQIQRQTLSPSEYRKWYREDFNNSNFAPF